MIYYCFFLVIDNSDFLGGRKILGISIFVNLFVFIIVIWLILMIK